MKQVTVPVAEIGMIVATRIMFAAGVLLLVADRISEKRRKEVAVPLILIGALSTAPLAMDMIRRMKNDRCASECEV